MSQRDDDIISSGTCLNFVGRWSEGEGEGTSRSVDQRSTLQNTIKQRKANSNGYATDLREIKELELILQRLDAAASPMRYTTKEDLNG